MELQRPSRVSAAGSASVALFLLLILGLAAGFTGGCREQSAAPIDRNLAPETVLTGVPGDSTSTFYRVQLFWAGYDQDGSVVAYEWAITDSLPGDEIVWRRTARSDSIFIFTVDENREVLGHRFYLRAVDNEGKRDPTPAFTFFAVRNSCVPSTWFTLAAGEGPAGETRTITSTNSIAPTDTIPAGWGVRFAWAGSDCDRALTPEGEVIQVGTLAGFDYRLSPLEFNWIRTSPRDTVRAYAASQLRSGVYEFRARARDDAGLAGLDPALRTFVWNLDPRTYFSRALLPGAVDSVEVFYASTTGPDGEYLPYAAGDTLPMTQFGVLMRAQVIAIDPDAPHRITAREARLVKDAAFWTQLAEDGLFTASINNAISGEYLLMARSLDGLERWDGSPDTLPFAVNKAARFVEEWTFAGIERWQRPQAGEAYPVPTRAQGYTGPDTLRVAFAAIDPDFVPVQLYLEFKFKFDEYPLPGGATGQEVLFSDWRAGLRADEIDGQQVAQWVGSGAAVSLRSGQDFLPGNYALRIVARERWNPSGTDASRYGAREKEYVVRFRLQ